MNHNDFKEYKPTQKQAHLQTVQSQPTSQSLQKSLLCQPTETEKIDILKRDKKEGRSANSVYVAIAGEVANRRSLLLKNFVLNGQVSASNPLLHIHAKR